MNDIKDAQTLESILEPIAEKLGFIIYDIKWARENNTPILQVALKKYVESGTRKTDSKSVSVDINDCESFSKRASEVLDESFSYEGSYHLEVGSPGLERVLDKPRHFALSIGEEVQIITMKKEMITGFIKSVNEDGVILSLDRELGGVKTSIESNNLTAELKELVIKYTNIKKAKSIFRF